MVEKIDADDIGLKHFLGSTENMRNSQCGMAISKSSFNLNNL
jgi:hypothetical protein